MVHILYHCHWNILWHLFRISYTTLRDVLNTMSFRSYQSICLAIWSTTRTTHTSLLAWFLSSFYATFGSILSTLTICFPPFVIFYTSRIHNWCLRCLILSELLGSLPLLIEAKISTIDFVYNFFPKPQNPKTPSDWKIKFTIFANDGQSGRTRRSPHCLTAAWAVQGPSGQPKHVQNQVTAGPSVHGVIPGKHTHPFATRMRMAVRLFGRLTLCRYTKESNRHKSMPPAPTNKLN